MRETQAKVIVKRHIAAWTFDVGPFQNVEFAYIVETGIGACYRLTCEHDQTVVSVSEVEDKPHFWLSFRLEYLPQEGSIGLFYKNERVYLK
jgi:hypothetical protein